MADGGNGPRTDIQHLVEVIPRGSGSGRSQPVFDPPLDLDRVRRWPGSGLSRGHAATVDLGLVDAPARQRREPLKVELEAGSLLVVGNFGTGKTNALRLTEVQFREAFGPEASVVAVDGGNGDLRRAAGAGAGSRVYCQATDLETTTVLVDRLIAGLERRESADAVAYEAMLLLVDDLGGLTSYLTRSSTRWGLDWLTDLASVITRGRRVGIFAAATVQTPRDLPVEFRGAFKHVVVLGESVDRPDVKTPPYPGFGHLPTGELVQIYLADGGDDVEGSVVREALATSALRATQTCITDWCDRRHGQLSCLVGVDQVTLEPVTVEPLDRHILVVGGSKSGKSSTLRSLGRSLAISGGSPIPIVRGRAHKAETDAWLAQVELPELPDSSDYTRPSGTEAVVQEFIGATWPAMGVVDDEKADNSCVILVDDARWLRPAQGRFLEALANSRRVLVVLATDANDASNGEQLWRLALRRESRVLFLRPDPAQLTDDAGSRVVGSPLRHRPGVKYPAGKAVLYDEGRQRVVWIPPATTWDPPAEFGSDLEAARK